MDNFKLVTLEELKKHNKPDDLWIAIEGKVYNVTKFRNEHPGGEETLDEVGGLNATVQFNEVGHSQEAKQMLKKYYVGHLVSGEESAAQTAISTSPTPSLLPQLPETTTTLQSEQSQSSIVAIPETVVTNATGKALAPPAKQCCVVA
ncbi:cytochrome b5 isoform X1 [Ceratitis capitata]|uniref:cytochrome b5 isoform X1 n=1 Tax=Ceratitis capitata TaxID=7213 RepID=UPI000329ACEE|nr:cytochrome b5 isoform X1 [Ceratitis capitata]